MVVGAVTVVAVVVVGVVVVPERRAVVRVRLAGQARRGPVRGERGEREPAVRCDDRFLARRAARGDVVERASGVRARAALGLGAAAMRGELDEWRDGPGFPRSPPRARRCPRGS